MKLSGRELDALPQALVVLVTVLLVAAGLCGLQWTQMNNPRVQGPAPAVLFVAAGVLEFVAIAASAAGIVVVLILWGVRILYSRFAKPPKDEVQKLFGDGDETKHEDEP